MRAIDLERAAVEQLHAPIELELVPFSMAAEVVVILQDQNSRVGPGVQIETCGGKTADPATDDHEIILLDRGGNRGDMDPTVTQGMRHLKRARMIAAQTHQCGRIGQLVLRRRYASGWLTEATSGQERAPRQCCGPVQNIPPGDSLTHSERLLASASRAFHSLPRFCVAVRSSLNPIMSATRDNALASASHASRTDGPLACHIQQLKRMVLLPTGELLVSRLIDRFEARDPLQGSVGPHRPYQATKSPCIS